ncbi:MAG: hypothetical protein M3348_17505 [Acidobacteriota bacterium]|nr:hypothetical protein [Acidobacteriota bacterium]
MITLGDGNSSAQATLTDIPHHLTFDRCYIHAYNTQGLKRGIGLNSRETSILNSYISGFKLLDPAVDSQAIAGWNGPGPFHVINNYIEGGSENVLFGGSDANNSNNQPSDIEIRRNLITKPLSWRPGDPSYAGTHWAVKNLLELKNAQRVTIEGNIFEYCWEDQQGGTAVVVTPRNQGGTNTWASVNNVIVRNNIIRHTNNGIGTLSQDDEQTSQVLHDVTITNNLLYDVDQTVWSSSGSGGEFISFNNAGGYNLSVQHNTAYTRSTGYLFNTGTQLSGLAIKDNIAHAHYLCCQQGYTGTDALNGAEPDGRWVASGNVLVLEGFNGSPGDFTYPAGDKLLSTWASVGFVDAGHNDFRLSSTSPYVSSATDGRAVGCDLDTLAAATDGGFGDNFNDNVMDTSKWYKGVLNVPQSAYNPNVTVLEQNQRLEITPVANTSVWSHNGYVSSATYDFTGARASVQVPQVPTGGTAYAVFTAGIDSNNWYRITTTAGQIKFQDTVNGVKNSTILTYNATQHKFWRIRHNAATDTVDFLTSSDGKTWTTQRSVARQLSVTALHIELDAGTFEPVSSPGTAIFDDLRFEGNYWGDDFNDNVQDTLKWYQGVLNLDPSAYNPGVTVLERNSRLEITPIANTSVWSHNGYVSSATYDFTGARVSVQVPQVPTGGTAYAIFAVGIDSNNWYRITTTAGQMNFQDMVGGVKNTSSITYNAAQHQYWRIRHDTASDTILFETSADAVNWTTRRTIARNLSITALQMELDAGTFEPVSAPGTAVFDNFRFERP